MDMRKSWPAQIPYVKIDDFTCTDANGEEIFFFPLVYLPPLRIISDKPAYKHIEP